jgi:hypothetical protein
MNFETLSNNKITLAAVPSLTVILYVIITFIRHGPSGFVQLLASFFQLPAAVIGSLIVYYASRMFGETVQTYALTAAAVSAIVGMIVRIIRFKPVKVNTKSPVVRSPTVSTAKSTPKSTTK